MRKWVNRIHLWLGLSVGLVVVILCLTGCLYAFQEEIQNLTQSYRFSSYSCDSLITPSHAKEIASKVLPGKSIHSIQYYASERSVVVTYYHFAPEEYYYLLYLHPTTGEVLQLKNMDEDFFRWVLMGHYYLWLPPEIGKPVASIATLLFFVLVVTGIILWFPRRKAARKQRFTIYWRGKWRRLNYDLHAVFGFYVSFFALVFCITGLIMGFEWFAKSFYWSISGGKSFDSYYESYIAKPNGTKVSHQSIEDTLWYRALQANPDFASLELHYAETDTSVIGISTNSDAHTFWQHDYRFFNPYTLEEITVTHPYGRFTEKTEIAEKLMRMNYDVHIGGIAGIGGKIVAFISSLVIMSLPITGFLLWWGRRR